MLSSLTERKKEKKLLCEILGHCYGLTVSPIEMLLITGVLQLGMKPMLQKVGVMTPPDGMPD